MWLTTHAKVSSRTPCNDLFFYCLLRKLMVTQPHSTTAHLRTLHSTHIDVVFLWWTWIFTLKSHNTTNSHNGSTFSSQLVLLNSWNLVKFRKSGRARRNHLPAFTWWFQSAISQKQRVRSLAMVLFRQLGGRTKANLATTGIETVPLLLTVRWLWVDVEFDGEREFGGSCDGFSEKGRADRWRTFWSSFLNVWQMCFRCVFMRRSKFLGEDWPRDKSGGANLFG